MKFKTAIEKSDTEEILNSKYINWDYFKNSTFFVEDFKGLLGAQIVRAILFANETLKTNIEILKKAKNADFALFSKAAKEKAKNAILLLDLNYKKDLKELSALPIKIVRHSQIAASGVDFEDNTPYARFARSIVLWQDIELDEVDGFEKSYCYITDAAIAIFALFEKGQNSKIYDIINPKETYSDIELAQKLCEKYTSSKLKLNLKAPKFLKTDSNISKIQEDTDWRPEIGFDEMFRRILIDFYTRPKEVRAGIKIRQSILRQLGNFIFNSGARDLEGVKTMRILGVPIKIAHKLPYREICENTPIQKNKVVFEDKFGSGYCGNLKYIADEIIRQKLDWELVWIDDIKAVNKNEFPPQIRLVQADTQEAAYELASAKIWLGTQRKFWAAKGGIYKKEGQKYLQTWHGSLGIKKTGFDVSPYSQDVGAERAYFEASMIDCLIVNAIITKELYRGTFYGYGEPKILGSARNDVYFKDTKAIKKKVFDYYNLKDEQSIVFYAPTYRDDFTIEAFTMDYLRVLEAYEQKTGKDCVMLIRMHPEYRKLAHKLIPESSKIIDASKYDDIQELMVAADVLITDYSSCIFDFMISRKTGLIYASDIAKYNTDRGFYYPLETTPFPIATNNDEIIENIKNFDEKTYRAQVDKFLKEKGCVDDGHSCERIAEFVKSLMKEE